MPSVGMRRTTRVFGARVLRSGRRMWRLPGEGKHMRSVVATGVANGEGWIELLDGSGDGGSGSGCDGDDDVQCKGNGSPHVGLKQDVTTTPKLIKNVHRGLVNHNGSVDRMWGSVYQRKRKRIDSKSFDFEGSSKKKRAMEDRKYGKQFVRKHLRKKIKETQHCPVAGSCGRQDSTSRVLVAVVESSCSSTQWFACFLSLVLRYMSMAKLRLLQLSAFVLSEPLDHVFSSHGIHFLRDLTSIKSSGICKVFGARCFIPLFAVDFSAVPSSFIHLHLSLLLRSACLPDVNGMDDRMDEVMEHLPCISYERDPHVIETVTVGDDNSGKGNSLPSGVGAPRLTGRAVQFKNGVNSRGIQKRSSLRSKRIRNPYVFRGRKTSGALVSNLFSSRNDGILLAPVASDRELRSSVRKSFTPNMKARKSSLLGLGQDIGSACCSANVLVIESDRCYRIKGATIKLENSASKQWSLAVKKDGITRYSLTAQKVMRPCSNNRITHDIIWTEDSYNWKFEFPDRRDWLIFKELYKECFDRNAQVPSANIIPIPGVHEVSGYADSNSAPYRRPDSYITVNGDELSRALAKSTTNYDMNSEDEDWLKKFNNESSARNENWKLVTEESFESIIDALERAFYFSPNDLSDEKAATKVCLDLERKEVIEAVYSYWMNKRKQKHSALIKVFQCYQPRRDQLQLLPKAILRKKRSFKRKATTSGRGKQRTFLQAIVAEQNAADEETALLKVKEAKAAVSRSEGAAVLKRQKAQQLMENADLVTYKAAMALRIAEAARVAESTDSAVSSFLQ